MEEKVIIEIRAGTGGEEAGLFAGDLWRMYRRFSEKQGFKADVLDSSQSSVGGIKNLSAEITGENAYGFFKYESGVHRIQIRI